MPVAAAGGALALADDLVLSRMGYGAMQLAGPGVFGIRPSTAGFAGWGWMRRRTAGFGFGLDLILDGLERARTAPGSDGEEPG